MYWHGKDKRNQTLTDSTDGKSLSCNSVKYSWLKQQYQDDPKFKLFWRISVYDFPDQFSVWFRTLSLSSAGWIFSPQVYFKGPDYGGSTT